MNMQVGLFLTDQLTGIVTFVYFGVSVGLDCRMMTMLFVAPDPEEPSFVSSRPLPVITSARRVIELEVAPHVVKKTSEKILVPGVNVQLPVRTIPPRVAANLLRCVVSAYTQEGVPVQQVLHQRISI
ncbi:MAG: hypothetical protein O2877_00270 [bacterium]|nr:hypothetical protein [bacterium]